MPRKRDLILGFFGRSRNKSPAPATSNVVPTTSPALAHKGATSTTAPSAAHPQAASSLVSPVTQATPAIESRAKEMASVAWEGVKTALVLLKESSDWFPPLQAATGGFLALVDAIELTSSNAADLELLRQKIDGLASIVKENSRDRRFPWLLRRLSEFAENLDGIVQNTNKKSNHGTLRRFAEGRKDKAEITAFAIAISNLVSKLQSELALYTSRSINELLSNECLKKLKESEAAHYDALISEKVVQRRGCTPNTRQKILDDLMKWAKEPHSSRLYWMNGMAGTGKTTISYSFCKQLQENGLLGANFFCSRSLAECSDIRYIIPTAARQLARSCPQLAPALLEVLGADFQLPSLGNQLKRLISEPYQRSGPVTDTLIIVIDALDECSNGSSDIRLFLEKICNYFGTATIPLKVFVTSRPEDAITRTITPLKPSSPSEWSVVRIHDIEKSLVQADIKVYVEDELTEVAKTRRWEDGWPPSPEVDAVVGNANRLFIYAATVIRYVKVDGGNPRRRLSDLTSSSKVRKVGKRISQSSGLSTRLIDELYKTILERARYEKNAEENLVMWMVLKLIICAQTPLTLTEIVKLLNGSSELEIEISTSDIRIALESLPSVISTPTDDDGVATVFHASFPDFLFDESRCGRINHIPFRESHQDIARLCLHFMDKSLIADDITGSGRWQTVDAIVEQKKIENWICGALGYSCMFWASHIDITVEVESLSAELEHFLVHQVLRWLEVLSLLRRLDIGIEILQRMKECRHPTLSSRFYDAFRFLKDIFDIINVWPCEVFHSGLVWVPQQSFIRETYLKTQSVRIVCGRRPGWSACELIIWHSDWVNSVAVSPDNLHIVSGSFDFSVRIWNALTGEEEHVLWGYSGSVRSVAVFPDNRHIVSGALDGTIQIWDVLIGQEEHELTGKEAHVLRGHAAAVHSVAVSPDNRHVVSGSDDKTIRIWNASTGEEEHVLRGHSGSVRSVAVSPDNRHIVSGSLDGTVRIWDVLTGEEEHVLRGHTGEVYSVAVSPDNRHVVSGSVDQTVRIWNPSTGEEEHVLRGHSDGIGSVVVTPDNRHVVSGSHDTTVRIWNLSTGEQEHLLPGHSFLVTTVAVTPDNRHVVSGSWDNTIRVWKLLTGEEEHVLRGFQNDVSSVTQSPPSVAVSPNNCHVVSGSHDKTVRIWNALTGEEEHVLKHSSIVRSVAVSPDNRHVVSGSSDGTVRIWNLSTGEEGHVLRGHTDEVHSVAVSLDNHRVVSGSCDKTVRIWNASTGEEEHVLRHSAATDSVMVIRNIPHIPIIRNYAVVNSVIISADNRYVISGSYDKTVRIWNASTGKEEHVLRGHTDEVHSVAVSLDNRHIVSGSLDGTIRIWNVSTSDELPLVIGFVVFSNNCHVMSVPQITNPPPNPISLSSMEPIITPKPVFISSMVTQIALLAQQGDNITSIPVIRRLLSGESLPLDAFLHAIWNGSPVVPITISPDDLSTVLLSNGKKCLAIPSTLRDIQCVAFSGSKVCVGYDSSRITILDIPT